MSALTLRGLLFAHSAAAQETDDHSDHRDRSRAAPVLIVLVPESLYPGQSAVILRRPGHVQHDVIAVKPGFTARDLDEMLRLLVAERHRSGDTASVPIMARRSRTASEPSDAPVNGKVVAYARRLTEAKLQPVPGIGRVPAISIVLEHRH